MKTLVHTPEEAWQWGHDLALTLTPGSVIALCGQLGAGKTQVCKGIVSGLGSQAEVTSPTFTLLHEYSDGRLPVFHFDFYRLETASEVLTVGWDDLMDQGGIILVEWADLFPDLFPSQTRWFTLTHQANSTRQIEER